MPVSRSRRRGRCSASVLLGLVVLNVAKRVARAFGVVIGVDEVLVFSMIWMVMVGMILVTAERSHIALDFLTARVGPRRALRAHDSAPCGDDRPPAAMRRCNLSAFVQRVAAIGQTSMALGMPMVIPHSALLVGLWRHRHHRRDACS